MNLLEISQTIRKVRQSQGMTVEQLAQKSGFSKGFISQVENFRQSPSLKALARIAEALGIQVSSLFAGEEELDVKYTFGKLDEGVKVQRNDGDRFGISYSALAYRHIGRKMDPFIIEYTPASPRDFMSHDTEEFFVLLAGELVYYLYDDQHPHFMHAGDTLYLRSGVPHRVELAEKCNYAKGLAVFTEPDLKVM